jgi:hypothetical protein
MRTTTIHISPGTSSLVPIPYHAALHFNLRAMPRLGFGQSGEFLLNVRRHRRQVHALVIVLAGVEHALIVRRHPGIRHLGGVPHSNGRAIEETSGIGHGTFVAAPAAVIARTGSHLDFSHALFDHALFSHQDRQCGRLLGAVAGGTASYAVHAHSSRVVVISTSTTSEAGEGNAHPCHFCKAGHVTSSHHMIIYIHHGTDSS